MTDLSELFDRDPLENAKDPEALRRIIAYFREKRAQFQAQPARAASKKKAESGGGPDIDLGALGL